MLTVDNLIKDYKTGFLKKNTRVLNGVSLEVSEGEIFGFVGPNGAGKTTTFKCILGFVTVTDGAIKIMGKSARDIETKKSIGYLPENPYFYDYLTGEELLQYMGDLQGLDKNMLPERVEELLEKVNMSHAGKVQLRKYSKGMLQRIGIAQALINDPDFLILDEPMSGLDPLGRREIKDIILEEKRKGKTILMSSHMLSDVESLCDRVGIIMGGIVVKTGKISELLEDIHSDYEMYVGKSDANVKFSVRDLNVTVEERADFFVFTFDEDIKNKVFQAVAGTGADIISLNPLRKSLEGFFVEEAEKEDASKS